MKAFDLALPFFAACNSLRLVGYVPQILRVARDEGGASAVSCATWGLFALANVSTVLYAALVVNDRSLAWVFGANTLGCSLILGLTLFKRRRHVRWTTPSRPALPSPFFAAPADDSVISRPSRFGGTASV